MRTKKKFVIAAICVLVIAVVFLCVNQFLKGIWIGDYKYRFHYENKTVDIVDYRGNKEQVVVPENQLWGYRISGIKGIYNDKEIKTLIIPSNVDYSIEVKYCSALTKVSFEEGTNDINATFIHCDNLKEVIIPEGVERISKSAFDLCDSLEIVDIPNSVNYIGAYAFDQTQFQRNHSNNKYYVAGNGVLIFYNGTEDEIVIPFGVKSVSQATYVKNNQKINEIYIPETVEEADLYVPEEAVIYFGSQEIKLVDEETNAAMIKGTVVAPEGSYMQEFCQKYDLNFRVMTEEEEAIWREKTEAAAAEITYQD